MQNTLVDLNNHLFERMERLNDEDLDDEALEKEIKSSKAMTSLLTNIIENAAIGLSTEKFRCVYGNRDVHLPSMLENKK